MSDPGDPGDSDATSSDPGSFLDPDLQDALVAELHVDPDRAPDYLNDDQAWPAVLHELELHGLMDAYTQGLMTAAKAGLPTGTLRTRAIVAVRAFRSRSEG